MPLPSTWVDDATPPFMTISTPPELTVIETAEPPAETTALPPELTVVEAAKPPELIASRPPELTSVPLATPLEAIICCPLPVMCTPLPTPPDEIVCTAPAPRIPPESRPNTVSVSVVKVFAMAVAPATTVRGAPEKEPLTAEPPDCRSKIPPLYTVTPLSTPPDWTVSEPPAFRNPMVVTEYRPPAETVTEPPLQMTGS